MTARDVSTLPGSCLTVDWLMLPDTGELIAKCPSEPGFKYRTFDPYSEPVKREAESRLKSFRSRHCQFQHWAPAAPGALAGLGWPVEGES